MAEDNSAGDMSGDMNNPEQPRQLPQDQSNAPLRNTSSLMHPRFLLLRYGMTSVITGVIDNLVFFLVFRMTGSILSSQIVGRIASASFNYRAVRRAVFLSDQHHHIVLPRYIFLLVINAAISYAGIRMFAADTPMGVVPAKLVTETLMFFANFIIQRAFIFTRRASAEGSAGL
jgi:hypothetical protein